MPDNARLLRVILEARLALRDALGRCDPVIFPGSFRDLGGNGHHPNSPIHARGNPYHDPHTGEFTHSGGTGKHAAKRKRRRLKRKLERLRHQAKAKLKEIRTRKREAIQEHHSQSAADNRSLAREHKQEIRQLDREHEQTRKTLGKDQVKEREGLAAAHQHDEDFHARTTKELSELSKKSPEELAKTGHTHEQVAAAQKRYDTWIAEKRVAHKEEMAEVAKEHQDQHKELAESHKEEKEIMAEDHAKAMKTQLKDQAKELGRIEKHHGKVEQKFRAEFKAKVAKFTAENQLGRKSQTERSINGLVKPRITPGRIHKAGSAESILRHCLRVKGWTREYKRGELTGEQHLDLLEEVRLYARAWLRHEAEGFARHYLDFADSPPRSSGGSDEAILSASRAWEWVEGPGGFLIQTEKPGFFANLGRFFRRVKQFVRESIVAGAMAVLGPAPLTGEELDEAEKQAQRQEQFFDRFHDEIKAKGAPAPRPTPDPTKPLVIDVVPPPMTPGEFVARVERYGNAPWQATQRANRKAAIQQGQFKYEKRRLGIPKTSHCDDCPPIAAMGWQPIGTLPEIGETECADLCLCTFVYSDKPAGREYFQGKKGPVPAPSEVQLLPDAGEVHMIAEPPGQRIKVPIAGPRR